MAQLGAFEARLNGRSAEQHAAAGGEGRGSLRRGVINMSRSRLSSATWCAERKRVAAEAAAAAAGRRRCRG